MKKPLFCALLLCTTLFFTNGNPSADQVSSLKATFGKTTLFLNESTTIKPTVSPKSSNQKVTYVSSNSSILEVDTKGKMTGKKVGTATITIRSANKKIYFSKKITVKKKVNVKSISLKTTNIKLERTKKYTLKSAISPTNASNKKIIWQSLNPNVATVSNGVITAKLPGKATIKATTEDGKKTKTAVVNVTPIRATGVASWPDSYNIQPGWKTTIWEQVYPKNADNQRVTWKSGNTSIATVTSDGYVTAKKAGKVTFTGTTSDGGFKTSTTIEVKNPTTSKDIVTLANFFIGRPYVWGGNGEIGFDCSSFTQNIFKRAKGIDIGRTTYDQAKISTKTSSKIKKVTKIAAKDILKKAVPGDLICYNTTYDHVGIYIGNYKMIHSPMPGMYVGIQELQWLPPDFALHIDWK